MADEKDRDDGQEPVAIRHVFLDTEVFVRHGFNFAARSFKALLDFTVNGRLVLLVTDVVRLEVERQVAQRVEEVKRLQKPLLQRGRVLASSRLESARSLLTPLNDKGVVADLVAAFGDFLERCGAATVKGSSANLDQILDDYFARRAPFDSEARKAEFPDAISVNALENWAARHDVQMYVVSADAGVIAACSSARRLRSVASLEALLDEVNSFDDTAAETIRRWILDFPTPVTSEIEAQFEDLAFFVEDDDGEIDVNVTAVTIDEVEVIEIGRDEALLGVQCSVAFEAAITYPDPDAQMRDSETGDVLTFRHLEVVQQEHHDGYAEVRARLDRDGRVRFSIVEVELTEPWEAIGIPIRHHHRDYH